jgi:hypothetical protein
MMMFRSSATLALLLATASSFQIPNKPKGTCGSRDQIVKTIAFGYLDGLAGESKGSESKSTKGAPGKKFSLSPEADAGPVRDKPVTAKKEKGAGPKFKPVAETSSNFLDGLKKNTEMAKPVTAEEGPTAGITKSYLEGLKNTPEIVKSVPKSVAESVNGAAVGGAKSSVVGLESIPDIVKTVPNPVPAPGPVFSLGGPRDTPPPPMSSRKPVTKPVKKPLKKAAASMSYLDGLKDAPPAPKAAFFADVVPTAPPVIKAAPEIAKVAPPAPPVVKATPEIAKVAPPAPPVVKPIPPPPVVAASVESKMPEPVTAEKKSGSSWVTNIALLGVGTVLGLLWENHLDLLDDDLLPFDNPFDSL